jgi:oligosaccharide repeat unit polymerase
MLPFYVKQVIQVFVASQIDNFFVGLRTELTYGDVDLGVLKYFINFSIVVFGICLAESSINATRANIIISWFAFVLAFFYALFSTGRTYFLFIFMMFFGVSTMLKKNFRIYRFLWFFPLIIALFTAYGLVYGKGGSFEENFAENLKSSSENTAVYIAGSLSAFDWEVENRLRPDGSALNSMRFFYVIGEKLGLVNPASVKKDLVQDFVSIPYEVNVYTVYSPYLRDFGIIYAMGMLFLFGWLHTWLFHKAEETKSANYSLYYAMLLFPLAMAFFQDQYMSLFSMWIQNIMFIEGILLINRLFFSGSSITAKKK